MENNKFKITRIVLVILLILLVSTPWYKFNIRWPSYMFGGKVILELNYIISSILLILYLLLSLFNHNPFSDVLHQVLIDSLLISLAYNHNISLIIPLLVVLKDIIITNKNIKKTKMDRASNIIIYIGFMFVFLGNIPFELLNLAIDQGLIIIGSCMGIYNSISILLENKKTIANM